MNAVTLAIFFQDDVPEDYVTDLKNDLETVLDKYADPYSEVCDPLDVPHGVVASYDWRS